MKTYEKPRLVALSLTSNDMLCGSCEIDMMEGEFKDLADSLGVPVDQLFSSTSGCTIPVVDEDKFGHDDMTALFTS